VAHRDGVLEFHHAVGNHETQAGRQLGSEELTSYGSLNDSGF
jgi:hypothetical protein